MRITAIICEYNPFHNGHKYQIGQICKNNDTYVIAIMSGNFVQRGIPSIISKQAKAEIALKNGCDLIIELPTPYSIASAEHFAFGATFIANALNCIDFLSFGCENNNIKLLKEAAQVSTSKQVIELTKKYLKQGISFAKARCKAINTLHGEHLSKVVSLPNNILAIEYIKNLTLLSSKIKFLPILRKECQHNSNLASGNFVSSTLLRKMILENDKTTPNYMPSNAYKILSRELNSRLAPANLLNCERAVLAKLRDMIPADFLRFYDVSEGLENKIYRAVQTSTSIEEIYSKIKSKRYTQLRVQRIILSAFLGINREFLRFSPPYIKILGFNERGQKILKMVKNKSNIPIISKYSDIKKLKDNTIAMKFFQTESRVFDLYNLMLPDIQKCGSEFKNQVIKV